MSVADQLRKLREQALDDDGAAMKCAAVLWPLLCDLAEAAEKLHGQTADLIPDDDAKDTWGLKDPWLDVDRALSVLADATQEPA